MYFYSKIEVLSASGAYRFEILLDFSANKQFGTQQHHAKFIAKTGKRLEEFILETVDGIVQRTRQFETVVRYFREIYFKFRLHAELNLHPSGTAPQA